MSAGGLSVNASGGWWSGSTVSSGSERSLRQSTAS